MMPLKCGDAKWKLGFFFCFSSPGAYRSSGKTKRCRLRRSPKECALSSERHVHTGTAVGPRILARLTPRPRPPHHQPCCAAHFSRGAAPSPGHTVQGAAIHRRLVDQERRHRSPTPDADPEVTDSKRKEGDPGSYPAAPVRRRGPKQTGAAFSTHKLAPSPALSSAPSLALTSCTGYILDSILTEPSVSPPSLHQATFTRTVAFFRCITAKEQKNAANRN